MVRFTSVPVPESFPAGGEPVGGAVITAGQRCRVILLSLLCDRNHWWRHWLFDDAFVQCNDRLFIGGGTCYQPAPILKGKNESALSIPVQRFFRILKGWPWQKSLKRPPARWR
ncbi:hypothetical protein [Mesorhizobium shangrilense]|uniref:Uncharacterized protein n=1 Tax=Mesorhizobium shangrilense TaxID=460060 RepID=A0ABV2DBA6_9HYPH